MVLMLVGPPLDIVVVAVVAVAVVAFVKEVRARMDWQDQTWHPELLPAVDYCPQPSEEEEVVVE